MVSNMVILMGKFLFVKNPRNEKFWNLHVIQNMINWFCIVAYGNCCTVKLMMFILLICMYFFFFFIRAIMSWNAYRMINFDPPRELTLGAVLK